jgi:hypothetical protein
MALFDRETDPAKERDGVPLDFGEFRVTLRRAGGANEAFELELDKAFKPFRATIRHGKMDPKMERELVFRTFAKTCVVKWETLAKTLKRGTDGAEVQPDGFVRGIDMRGTLVPDTVDNLVALFTALNGVYLDVHSAAKGEDLFRIEQREHAAGN